MNIIIKSTNIELIPKIKDYIDKKIGGLEKYFNKIIEARVEIGIITKHHQAGKIYRAEVNLKVPGGLIRVEKTVEKDIFKAIDKVRDHLARLLKRYKDKRNK